MKGRFTPLQRLQFEARQREITAMELTFVQIQSLPVTTDCPEEER